MTCCWCGKQIKDKDMIGINRKLLSVDTTNFYCIGCMADYFCCEKRDILAKIEEFKEEGCTLFT